MTEYCECTIPTKTHFGVVCLACNKPFAPPTKEQLRTLMEVCSILGEPNEKVKDERQTLASS